MRLSLATNELVRAEARRTRRSRGAIVESLADEAARCRLLPGIAFRGEDWARRPWIVGTALDVWQVIEAYRDFGSAERMIAETDLTERQVRLALAYYGRFPEEIDEAIAENQRSIDEHRTLFPTFSAK